jgi:hypothetical protein
MKTNGAVEVHLYVFLSLAIDGSNRSVSPLDLFQPGKELNRNLDGAQNLPEPCGEGEQFRKLPKSPRLLPSHYTN